MDLEREIVLLKEKLALLEKIKELQDAIKVKECTPITPYIPYVPYPVYPPVYPTIYPWVTYTTTAGSTYVASVTPRHFVTHS